MSIIASAVVLNVIKISYPSRYIKFLAQECVSPTLHSQFIFRNISWIVIILEHVMLEWGKRAA
jgi:hypothetical protein